MTIYLINIALIIFWRLLLGNRPESNSKKIYCGIVAFQWILVSGLRDWRVGADTYAYYLWFEEVKRERWSELFGNLYGYLFRGLEVNDPGYNLLTKVFQIVFKDYQVFLIAIALLFMGLMAMWIYRNSASPCPAFIIFSTLFYSFYAVTGPRPTIATALLVFLGYELIKERKLLKFAVVAFVAFLIHKSSLVFVPYYFPSALPVSPIVVLAYLVAIPVVTLLGEQFYGPVALWMGFSENQIEYDVGGAELFAVLLALLSVAILILYPLIKQRREDAQFLFHATALTLLSALLVVQNQAFMRVQQYYSLFIMITIPEIFNTLKKEQRVFAYVALGSVMILYLIGNNPYYSLCF